MIDPHVGSVRTSEREEGDGVRMQQVRDALAERLRGQAIWQWMAAYERPADGRSQRCFESLSAVADLVETLPDDDPVLVFFADRAARLELWVHIPWGDDTDRFLAACGGEVAEGFHPRAWLAQLVDVVLSEDGRAGRGLLDLRWTAPRVDWSRPDALERLQRAARTVLSIADAFADTPEVATSADEWSAIERAAVLLETAVDALDAPNRSQERSPRRFDPTV